MQIHNLRQALLNKNPKSDTEPQMINNLAEIKGAEKMYQLLNGTLRAKTASGNLALWQTQHFDFGRIDFMHMLQEAKVAGEAFYEGFLNLPAPMCIFEFHSNDTSGADVFSVFWLAQIPPVDLTGEDALRLPWIPRDKKSGIFCLEFISGVAQNWISTGSVLEIPRDTEAKVKWTLEDVPDFETHSDYFHLMRDKHIDKVYLDATNGQLVDANNEGFSIERVASRYLAFLLCALGRLDSKGVEREYIEAPDRLNKSRVRKGKEPLVSHTVVKVAPVRETLGHSGEREEYTPKRYHFRRGHVRRFKNGQKTWVRGCFVGSPEAGSVTHDYRVAA